MNVLYRYLKLRPFCFLPVTTAWFKYRLSVQVNLFQKHTFLHQFTLDMTTDCSLNFNFSTRKMFFTQQFGTFIFLYWSCKSMNNLLSYCGLTDSRMSASDTDLHVHQMFSRKKDTEFSICNVIGYKWICENSYFIFHKPTTLILMVLKSF